MNETDELLDQVSQYLWWRAEPLHEPPDELEEGAPVEPLDC